MFIKPLFGLVLTLTSITFAEEKSAREREGRMVFGEVINITQVPYIVYIESVINSEDYRTRICAGAIVSRWNVITAAHCIVSNKTHLRSGSSLSSKYGRVHHPDIVTLHPNFTVDSNNGSSAFDIAVIQVKEPFFYNNSTKSIKLLKSGEEINFTPGGEMSGWGTNEKGTVDYHLRRIYVEVQNKNECNRKFDDLGWHFKEDQICVKPKRNSQSACFGDSGSPLIVNNHFVGVNIYGGGCDSGRWGTPSAFTEVFYHREWINKLVKYDF